VDASSFESTANKKSKARWVAFGDLCLKEHIWARYGGKYL
jgi:hypothetical protein